MMMIFKLRAFVYHECHLCHDALSGCRDSGCGRSARHVPPYIFQLDISPPDSFFLVPVYMV